MQENNDKENKKEEQKNEKKNRKISLSEFELLQTVGIGSFGRVRLTRHKKIDTVSVMKK